MGVIGPDCFLWGFALALIWSYCTYNGCQDMTHEETSWTAVQRRLLYRQVHANCSSEIGRVESHVLRRSLFNMTGGAIKRICNCMCSFARLVTPHEYETMAVLQYECYGSRRWIMHG